MLKVTQSSRVAAQLYKGVINWHWITDFPNFLFIFILDLTQSTLLSNPSFPIFESLTFLSIKRFKPRDHVRIHASGLELACNWGQKRDIITHKSLDIKFFSSHLPTTRNNKVCPRFLKPYKFGPKLNKSMVQAALDANFKFLTSGLFNSTLACVKKHGLLEKHIGHDWPNQLRPYKSTRLCQFLVRKKQLNLIKCNTMIISFS